MATRAMEELDGGLGSCQVDEDLSVLADPCPGRPQEDSVRGTGEGAGGGSPHPHPPSESGGPPSETRTWTSTLDWLKPCSLFPTSVPISVLGDWGGVVKIPENTDAGPHRSGFGSWLAGDLLCAFVQGCL